MSVIVIGAGIVGASFAYHLAREGADVTLVDRGQPGQGTSAATAAYLNFFRKQPDHYAQLHLEAIAYWHELAREIGAEAALHTDGNLYWEGGDEEWRGFDALAERASAHGQRWRRVAPAELAPVLAPPPSAPAWLLPDEGWVDVPLVIERLVAAARAAGARVRFGEEVLAIARDADGYAVSTPAGTLRARRLVLAAGPDSAAVGRLLGVDLPVERKPGVVALTTPLAQAPTHVVFSPGFSFRPDRDGRVLISVGERFGPRHAQWGADERARVEAELLAALRAWVPSAADAGIASLHTGIRPIPVDGLPLVGFLPGWPEVYLAATHSGINLAPLFGRLGSAEILGGEPSPLLASYRPQRLLRA